MKKVKKIPLSALCDRLQALMHYEQPASAFDALLYGFERKIRSIGWARNVRHKGYLSARVAHDFAQYCGYPIDKM